MNDMQLVAAAARHHRRRPRGEQMIFPGWSWAMAAMAGANEVFRPEEGIDS